MDRPNWYEDDGERHPRSRMSIPPLRTWSGNSLLMLTLVVMLFLQLLLSRAVGIPLGEWLQFNPAHLVNPLRWYEFVSYALIHSEKGLLHLGMNCLLLWFLGPQVEAILQGRRPYLYFCAAAAAAAALVYLLEAIITSGPALPMVGASGICYAVLVAFATHDPQREMMLIFPPIVVKAWALAAILMGASLLWHLGQGQGGTAHMAHLGGGIFGFLFIRHRARFRALVASAQARKEVSKEVGEADRRREVDRILEKISQSGIGSLTRAERRYLDAASRDIRGKR